MKKNHQGFSLVELMISIVLGIILMTGVIQMFLSSRSAFSSQQAISRVQETGRLAIEFLSKDVRMAGYLGCASKRKENNISRLNSANTFANDWLNSIQGYHITNTGGGVPAGSGLVPAPLKDTDLFVLRGAYSISTVTTADNTNTLLKGAVISQGGGCGAGAKINGFCNGDIVAESDCTAATVFQISSLNNNVGVMEVGHAAASSPGNQVVIWGGPTPSAVQPDHKYLVGSEIFKLSRIVYFIGTGTGPTARPSLYQNVDGVNTELLEGVEDMSVAYGTATGTGDNPPPDLYRDAAAITAAGDWQNVLSVRIQLLIQSAEDGVVAEKQTYTFDTDINKVAPDRRLRQVFVSTVGIRSRVQ